MTTPAPDPVKIVDPGDPEPPADSMVAALVNNMPDGAFIHAEAQFLGLLEAGFAGRTLYVKRYTAAPAGRSSEIVEHLTSAYFPLEALWDSPTDLVIVTGSEPLAPSLHDEYYWPSLVRLLDWSVANCRAVLLSCLSAHAALLHFDGIERQLLATKCSGVFVHDVTPGHPLTSGLPARVALPHSRLNGIDAECLASAGYEVLLDAEVGWGVAARRRVECQLLLFQGHPEYDADSLLREYRRDLLRYLQGETGSEPALPEGYLDHSETAAIDRFRRRVDSPGPPAGVEFPFDEIAARLRAGWADAVRRLSFNWLQEAALPPVGAGN